MADSHTEKLLYAMSRKPKPLRSCMCRPGSKVGSRRRVVGSLLDSMNLVPVTATMDQLSRDQNPLVGNPLASGNKDLAVSKRVGFVSFRKQNRSACCAVSRRKLLFGALHVATVSAC